MAELDIDEVLKLLQIPEKIANVAPALTAISGEAMARLRKINYGLEEAKARDNPPASNLSGMPVWPNVPSQPVEEPASEIAAEAPPEHEPSLGEMQPVEPTPQNAAPRAFPNVGPDGAEPETEVRRL